MVICAKCHKDVASGEVRFINATTYVCLQCFESREGKLRTAFSSPKEYDARPLKKKRMKCADCGFINKYKADANPPTSCSYCGKKNLVPDYGDAANLLADE